MIISLKKKQKTKDKLCKNIKNKLRAPRDGGEMWRSVMRYVIANAMISDSLSATISDSLSATISDVRLANTISDFRFRSNDKCQAGACVKVRAYTKYKAKLYTLTHCE